MTKNDRQIGKFESDVEWLKDSMKSLHEKFDANAGKCIECRKDIEKQTVRIAAATVKNGMLSVKLWVALTVLSVAGFIMWEVFKPSIPNIRNAPTASTTVEASQ